MIGAAIVWGLSVAAIAADLYELWGPKPNVTAAAQGATVGAYEADLPDYVIKNLTSPMKPADVAWIRQAQAEARASQAERA